MRSLRVNSILYLGVITAIWFTLHNLWPQPFNYFSFRSEFVNFSGIIAMSCMSFAMYSAARPKWLENYLQGLDRSYRLHKWAGITALIAGLTHWWFAQGTKWMVAWGVLPRPERRMPNQEVLSSFEVFYRGLRGVAEVIGEWAFYIALILLVMALVKRIPYRLFVKFHKILAITYLFLVFHALVLFNLGDWLSPLGVVMLLLLSAGSWGAWMILRGKVGETRKISATVGQIEKVSESGFIRLLLAPNEKWGGHKPGQFVFLSFDKDNEPPHPYSISSSWNNEQDSQLQFLIKPLGDYTQQLADNVEIGDSVVIEGPYGKFNFESRETKQIWIAAGVGITPFIAQLEHLVEMNKAQEEQEELSQEQVDIELYYSLSEYNKELTDYICHLSEQAGVSCHIIQRLDGDKLDGVKLRKEVNDWQERSIWFCGPKSLSEHLQKSLGEYGLRKRAFHQEFFEFR